MAMRRSAPEGSTVEVLVLEVLLVFGQRVSTVVLRRWTLLTRRDPSQARPANVAPMSHSMTYHLLR
jgi:hypothetical protein